MSRTEFSGSRESLARLSCELERQAGIYRGLGVSKDVIMRFVTPRPDTLPKELKIPVVTLGTSVDLNRQAAHAGIETYYDFSRGYDAAGGVTFGFPHLIWMSDGSENLNKSVEWVRSHLPRNARPATQYDGIAFGIVNPGFRDLLRNHAIDLPGTSVGSARAPVLFDWLGRPGLSHSFVDDAHPYYGSALSGS